MEIITIKNVKAYIKENIVYLKLEDVARGLGFTQIKNGVEYIRWETIIKYCNEFSQQVGKDDFIPENIFYKLCMKANNDVARKFQDLVADEILPSIRKHGAYMTQETIEKAITSPDFLIKLATTLKMEQEKNRKLEIKIEEDKPRVAFAETIEKASDCILVREFAKLLGNENIYLGEKKIYKILREWGYILKNNTEPTQIAVKQGLFKIKEGSIHTIKGNMLVKTTVITGKGQLFLLDKFKKLYM